MGCLQIFGGLDAQGRVQSRVLAVVGREGDELAVEVAPLADRPGLYPMSVHVDVDGVEVGRFELTHGSGETTWWFDLPSTAGAVAVDVLLRPSHWTSEQTDSGAGTIAFQLLSLRTGAR